MCTPQEVERLTAVYGKQGGRGGASEEKRGQDQQDGLVEQVRAADALFDTRIHAGGLPGRGGG